MRANDASFEIRVPSQLAGGDFGCGIPKRPFVRPERPGWGEGVTFATGGAVAAGVA